MLTFLFRCVNTLLQKMEFLSVKNQHELPTILPLSYLAAFELHNIRLGMHIGNSQPTDFLGFELSFATDIECKYHHMQQKYS